MKQPRLKRTSQPSPGIGAKILGMKIILIVFCAALMASAQDIVFLGEPGKQVVLTDGHVFQNMLGSTQSKEYQCRITRHVNTYQWQSRGGVELVRSETGGFIWYRAVDGSGYVKVVKKDGPVDMFEFEYVEHLHVALGSMNYFGKATIHRK